MRNLWLLFFVGLSTGFISEKLFVSSQSPISTADDLYIEGQMSGEVPVDDEDGEDDGSGSGSGDNIFGDLMEQEKLLKKFLNLSRTTVSKEMVPVQPQPTAGSPLNPLTTAAVSQDSPTTVEVTKTTPDKILGGDSDEEKVQYCFLFHTLLSLKLCMLTLIPKLLFMVLQVAGVGPTADWFTQNTSPSSTSRPPSDTTSAKFSIDISVSNGTAEDNSLDSLDISTPKGSSDEVQISENDNEIVGKEGRGSRIYEMDSPEEVTSENLWERTEVLAAVIACGVVGFLCAVFLLLLLGYRMKKKDEGSYELGDTKLSSTTYHKAPTKEFYA
ncbi:syndecan-3-like [Labrus mixtus]|uniref:syndecan-3-like n=1 Tax=Labrus mixtus TaxID=508554 RepID=UPI0029C0A830|nr:syndecan-3-like [Labrus mixtus]